LPANEPEDIIGSCPIDVLELEQGLQIFGQAGPRFGISAAPSRSPQNSVSEPGFF